MDFPDFSKIFEITGRIDLKYNSTITEKSKHFDNKDKCHQVIFTLGWSTHGLCVKEVVKNSNGERTENIRHLTCHRTPTAFDGRFQHWVNMKESDRVIDRIAVVCYLTDVPSYFRHPPMTMKDLKSRKRKLMGP